MWPLNLLTDRGEGTGVNFPIAVFFPSHLTIYEALLGPLVVKLLSLISNNSLFSSTAMDEGELQNLGITHLLNAAHGKKLYHVQTGPDYYSESGIIYHGVPAMDMFTFKLDRYFDEACDFIGKAVGTKTTGKLDGKILVHCKEGVSRSASLVLAYLVRDQEMHLKDAVRLVRSKRQITPNEGFLQQLIDFSYKLGRA